MERDKIPKGKEGKTMKYNVKGIIWPMGYMVEVDMDFDTLEEAEAYCADKTENMCGEQFVITPHMV